MTFSQGFEFSVIRDFKNGEVKIYGENVLLQSHSLKNNVPPNGRVSNHSIEPFNFHVSECCDHQPSPKNAEGFQNTGKAEDFLKNQKKWKIFR